MSLRERKKQYAGRRPDGSSKDRAIRQQEMQRRFDELERDGLIMKNGQFRNGKPVYVITELGMLATLTGDEPAA
jgi:hypothetical protein